MGPKFKPSLSTNFSESESGKFSGMETTHHSYIFSDAGYKMRYFLIK